MDSFKDNNKLYLPFSTHSFLQLIVHYSFLLHCIIPSTKCGLSEYSSKTLKEEIERNWDGPHLRRVKRDESFENVELGPLSQFAHGLKTGGTRLLDDKTIQIDQFYYDGSGVDARFLVGTGDDFKQERVKLDGVIIPDENGSCDNLKKYSGKDIRLVLPGNLTWADFNYFAVYSIQSNHHHNFGAVHIPVLKRPVKLKEQLTYRKCD